MAVRVGSSFSCLSTSLSSPSRTRNRLQLNLSRPYINQQQESQLLRFSRVDQPCKTRKWNGIVFAVSENQSQQDEIELELASEEKEFPHPNDDAAEDLATVNASDLESDDDAVGKPGFVSFYRRPYKAEIEEPIIGGVVSPKKSQNNPLWFVGPAVLVASFVFPSLYLRRLLSAVFEDSLLTDFLILFFTEALFYCGVAVFVLLLDRLRRPCSVNNVVPSVVPPEMEQRISSVATLVLSLIIPMVTMGFVWPWTGPAASATLAPYLVGIVVQFAFEQYARYKKSLSWPVIPIIFQVYRLHQLNRAAQLVTALSFTVRGAEMTAHNLAINASLGTLINVLQLLGVICIWSLSNFLMRFFPATPASAQ